MKKTLHQTKHIGIVLYPNVMRSAVYGLIELFDVANKKVRERTPMLPPLFEVHCWTDGKSNNTAFLDAKQMKKDTPALDLIIAPPAMGDELPSHITVTMERWLHQQYKQGCVFTSACVGAFVLAAAGFLKNRKCTTHWGLTDALSKVDKSMSIDTDKILIDDGDIITAGGVMAWLDLGLHIVNRFAGPELVMALSKFFIIDSGHREQRFYQDFSPRLGHGDLPITKLQHYLQVNYQHNVTLKTMSEVSHITLRTLQRRFASATGYSPSIYLQRLRIQKAKEQLETTQQGIDRIAWQVGYEDISAFRKRFKHWIGLSPSEYRKRFMQVGNQ